MAANFSHIFWNMLGLYFFGPVLESRLGGARFVRLYLVSGLVGGLAWLIFSAFPAGGFGALIGASGGVFGIQLGFAYFWPRQPIYIWGILPIEARWLVVFVLRSLCESVGDGLMDQAWADAELAKIETNLAAVPVWKRYRSALESERGANNLMYDRYDNSTHVRPSPAHDP